jgi:uncharacterized membrane protein YesL
MHKLFNYDNKLIQLLNKAADMMIVSCLWFFLTITVVGFGPACVACYHAMAKAVRYGRESAFKEFFRALKSGFWKGLIYGLMIMAFAVSIAMVDLPKNLPYFAGAAAMDVSAMVVMVVKVVLLVVLSLYVFPIISRFEMPIVRIFGASCLLSVRYLLATVLMVLLAAAAVYAVASLPFLIILIPGLFSYLQTGLMERIMRANMSEEDMEVNEKEDQWYLD